MSREADRFERLLAAIGRRALQQERESRIRPPTIRARRRGPTREEMRQAMALADAVLLAYGHKLSPMARQTLQTRRQPAGDFSYAPPYQPTPEGLALLEQLRMGQVKRYHQRHPLHGPQASYEPSGAKEKLGGLLLGLGFAAFPLGPVGAVGIPLSAAGRKLQEADTRRQLLDLTYVPSPPTSGRWPWTLLSETELADVKRRLYSPGTPMAWRMAAGY